MCSVGEDCCPPTETKLFARSSKRTSRNRAGHGVTAVVAGGEACSEHEGCCQPGRTSYEEAPPVDQMEFWGTEVTPRKPQVNDPGDDTYVHVSQAALGPSKDGKTERVVVRVESGGKNLVLGTLSSGKVDQMTLDLIFDREFKLSHTSTSSSVFFCGYRTDKRQDYDDESDDEDEVEEDEDDDEEDDEPVPQALPIKENGTNSAKGAKAAKKQPKVIEQVVEAKAKKSEKKAELLKASLVDEEAEEGEESDDDDEDADKAMTMDFDLDDYDEEDDSEFELDDMNGSEGETDEGDEDESDDEEESDEDDSDEDDVAAELGKKRGLQVSAKKAGGDGKKPRLDTPAKPGGLTAAEYWESLIVAGGKGLITTPGKKGAKGAVETKATPVSTKNADSKGSVSKTPQKTPGKEAKVKTPKTDKSISPGALDSAKKLGAHTCAECSRNFTTESALSQHVVAKHKK